MATGGGKPTPIPIFLLALLAPARYTQFGPETIPCVLRKPAELRPRQALQLWHDVTFDLVRDDASDLSARQMAVLLTVYLEPPPHTVRGLAKKLGVTKPAITRALDTMGRLGLLARRRDETDRRNVLVQRTLAGALHVLRLGDAIVARHRTLPL
jgi:DNA-binding MarR family transcriptional regulator